MLLVFICGVPLAADAAPTTVNISWGENTDGLDVPGHITGKALAIYDSSGRLQNVTSDITEEPYSTVQNGTYKIYTAAYSLEPGAYRWEGKSGGDVIGGGRFDVDSTVLNLYLVRATMSVAPHDRNFVSRDRGVRLDLYDYHDTGKTTPLQPYFVELFDPEDPELGVIEKRYLVLHRPNTRTEASYSYRISSAEDAVGEDGRPIYIREGTFSYYFMSTMLPTKKQMMTHSYLCYTGKSVNEGVYGGGVIDLPAIKTLIFKVTSGADLHFYMKPLGYYGEYTEFPQKSFTDSLTAGGGYDVYTFEVDLASGVSGNYMYEAGGGEFVRDFMAFNPPDESVVPGAYTITVDLDKSDDRDWSAADYDANWQDADMYLNVSDDRYLELKPGGSFDLHPLRVWQAVMNVMGNLHTEPDYHLELIGAPGGSETLDSIKGKGTKVSNDVIEIEMTGDRGWERYKITGKGPGTAVIKVTYDALTNSAWQVWNVVPNENGSGSHYEYPTHRKNTDIGQQLFYPSEPGCTAVVVVNVTENGAADNAGVSTNIREREFDTIYFASPQDSAAYTFAPTTAAGGDVSVRVHKPLHNTEWGAGWAEYGTKPSGTSFDVTLYEGHNIVEVSGGGAKKYHSIYAKPAKITVTNMTHPEGGSDYFTPGDEVNISIKGLKVPVQKLAGIYNPGIMYDRETGEYRETGCFLYDDAAGNTLESTKRQYDMKLGMDLNYVIQEDTTLRNGRIDCAHIGAPLGMHRFFDTDIRPNLDEDAETVPGIYSTLPDIVLTVKAPEEPNDPINPDKPEINVDSGGVIGSDLIDNLVTVAAEAKEPTAVINVNTDSGSKNAEVSISAGGLRSVADSGDVENIKIASAIGEVTLNTAAIKDILAEAGIYADTVDLVIASKDEADKETLLESGELTEAQETALADESVRDVYDISLYAGEKKLFEGKSASEGSKLTIGLPYKLRDGEKARGVGVSHIGEDGAERMPAAYNSDTELAVFTTSHLSLYGVTYTPVSENSGGGCDAGFGALTLAVLALMCGIRGRKK